HRLRCSETARGWRLEYVRPRYMETVGFDATGNRQRWLCHGPDGPRASGWRSAARCRACEPGNTVALPTPGSGYGHVDCYLAQQPARSLFGHRQIYERCSNLLCGPGACRKEVVLQICRDPAEIDKSVCEEWHAADHRLAFDCNCDEPDHDRCADGRRRCD